MKIAPEVAQCRDDPAAYKKLEAKLPPWLSHAMVVSSASIEKSDGRPFLQSVAEQLVQVATRIIQFNEIVSKKSFNSQVIAGWNLAQLEANIKTAVKMQRAYGHVIEVMEALAPQVKEAGLLDVLDPKRRRIIEQLAPQVRAMAPEHNPIFDGYLQSRKDAAHEMKIEFLARSLIIQNEDPKLRGFSHDSPEKMVYALELARKKIAGGGLAQ